MPASQPRPPRSLAPLLCAALLAGAAPFVHAAPVSLDPTLAGQYAAGTGAQATFLAIDSQWRGSTVLWSESDQRYANGTPTGDYQPIGSYTWGTGLWGLADWQAANNGTAPAVASWSGLVGGISFGDDTYRSLWSGSWGNVDPLPGALPQDNWTGYFTGYLRITDAGLYNFGVLYDDGFFLRIYGSDNQMVEISSDFILDARQRLGFDDDLLLQQGLYRFELGIYERLEAGVIDLAWRQGDGDWTSVPTEHLVNDPTAVPLPGTLAMLGIGFAGLAGVRGRRQRPAA